MPVENFDIIHNHNNSFDDCFTNYKPNTPLYASPLVMTKNAYDALDSSPLLWNNETNGFLFQNDRIITNITNLTDNIGNRELTLLKSTRFYSVYKEDQWAIYYIFFSKVATEALLHYHSYAFTDEIVGAIALHINQKSFLGSTTGTITLLITNKPTGKKYACWDLGDYIYYERYNEIFKNIGTRYLLMGLIFKLQSKVCQTLDYAWENPDIDTILMQCIDKQYNSLQDVYKDICHIIMPDKYKYVHDTPYSQNITERIIQTYINNLFYLVYRNRIAGQLGIIRLNLEDPEKNLIEKTYTYIFGIPQITLSRKDEGQLVRNTIVLYVINRTFYNVRRALGVSSLWLYYNLFYLRNNTKNSRIYNLANILIQCVLYTNYQDFIPIISKIKNESFILKDLKIFKVKTSWKPIDDSSCLYELLYFFNSFVDKSHQEDLELHILGRIQNISNGYNFESINEHLKRNINHTTYGIEKAREFYANMIYNYIEEQIKLDPHFGYK